jgi:hypothetical protein
MLLECNALFIGDLLRENCVYELDGLLVGSHEVVVVESDRHASPEHVDKLLNNMEDASSYFGIASNRLSIDAWESMKDLPVIGVLGTEEASDELLGAVRGCGKTVFVIRKHGEGYELLQPGDSGQNPRNDSAN